MGIKVKNIKETSKNTCKCDSWLDYWRRFSGSFTVGCSNNNCFNTAELGAHVIKSTTFDHNWYIVPLCRACNQLTEEFEVMNITIFAPPDIQKNCVKQYKTNPKLKPQERKLNSPAIRLDRFNFLFFLSYKSSATEQNINYP